MHAVVREILGPMLGRARDRGELRAGLDDDRIVEWLRGIYVMMILREDLNADGERALISEFVLPWLVAPPLLPE